MQGVKAGYPKNIKCLECGKMTVAKTPMKQLCSIQCFRAKDWKRPETRLRVIFNAIRSRCNDISDVGYARYGGRGITSSWDSLDAFRADMLASYLVARTVLGDNVQIDR